MQAYPDQPQQTLIHTSIFDVQTRLKELGLTLEWLLDALEYAWGYWAMCTSNDVGNAQGSMLYFGCNRGLRDQLMPERWFSDVFKGVEVTVHPTGLLAIRVQSGDSATGDRNGIPTNRNESGHESAKLVSGYQPQLPLFIEEPESTALDPVPVWVLLTYPAGEEMTDLKAEISLPKHVTNGKIISWHERIIIPHRDALVISSQSTGTPEELDIQVRRRA